MHLKVNLRHVRKTEVTSVIVQCACKKNEIIKIITGLVLKKKGRAFRNIGKEKI